MMGYWGMGYDWPLRMMWWIWPFAILDLVLKGISLWRSAQAKEKWWFVALLLVNSLGILPAVYLFTHQKPQKKRSR